MLRPDIRRAERRGLVRSGADGASGQRRIRLHQRHGAAPPPALEQKDAAQRTFLPAEAAEHAARPLRRQQREQEMFRPHVAVTQGAGLPRGAAQHLDQCDGQLWFSHGSASFRNTRSLRWDSRRFLPELYGFSGKPSK